MLLKKIDRSRLFLEKNHQLFACPRCHTSMKMVGNSLTCQSNHQFDLNKKGSLYFLDHTVKTDYDKEMLSQRQVMIQQGLYQPLMARLLTAIQDDQVTSVMDIGCGEGSFLQQLAVAGLPGIKIGFDISKDGVALATNQEVDAFWCVADITNLPFADGSMSHLLNIFSPSHYQEFRRVLKPKGKLIKVVPEAGYLKELRELFYPDESTKQEYSNDKVVAKFAAEMTTLTTERLTYQVPVTDDNYQAILAMSPLKWGADPEKVMAAQALRTIDYLTVDVLILIGE